MLTRRESPKREGECNGQRLKKWKEWRCGEVGGRVQPH